MKVVVCKDVVGIVQHLREEDGERNMSDHVPLSHFLCSRLDQKTFVASLDGWDTPTPAPVSPVEARQRDEQGEPFCRRCIEFWEAEEASS